MKRSPVWIVPGLVLSLTACTVQAQPNTSARQVRPADVDLERACPGTRWVAILRQASKSCPEVDGFRGCALSDDACRAQYGMRSAAASRGDGKRPDPTVEKAREEALRASGLDRVCLYDAKGGRARSGFPSSRSKFLRSDKDCQGAAALGSELEARMWKPLEQQFLDQTGRADSTPTSKGRPVRLALVDSQPTGEGVPTVRGCSPHGYTLAHMAQKLVCATPGLSSEGCAATVATRLALNVSNEDRGLPNPTPGCKGGTVGWIGDLAPAIFDEIDAWIAQKDAGRLVLNLSVGWEPQLFGGLRETSVDAMPAQVQAVYRSLVYAARMKALVVAAAGNSTPGPTANDGPILPAAWEGWVPGKGYVSKPNQAPLIYAVGGVRWNGYPLPNSRSLATPPRVAFGDHAIVEDLASKDRPTAVLTGTSVSSLVVAASAAVLWADRPDVDPAKLMQTLEKEFGEPLSRTAHFGSLAGSKTRRICLGKGGGCGSQKLAPPVKLGLEAFAAPALDGSILVPASPPAPCSPVKTLRRPGGPQPASFCPCDQFKSARLQPWVDTQPGSDPCPFCTIHPPKPPDGLLRSLFPPMAGAMAPQIPSKRDFATLYVDIPESWWVDTTSLKATTLDIGYSNGDVPILTFMRYSLGQDFQKGGPATLAVRHLETPPLLNPIIRTATLNFVLERGGEKLSISSPLFFSP